MAGGSCSGYAGMARCALSELVNSSAFRSFVKFILLSGNKINPLQFILFLFYDVSYTISL